MDIALIIDCESTGFNEPKATEVAYFVVDFPALNILETFEQRVNPGKPIELGAIVVTHILEEDIKDCPSVDTLKLPEASYWIAHNCDYDWNVLGKPDVKRIDTLALSRWLHPELDSHTQGAMLYYYMGPASIPLLKKAHSALCDITNLRDVLQFLLNDLQDLKNLYPKTLEELWEISELARIPIKMTFGKHRGKTYLEVAKTDPSYFTWWETKSDTKPDEYQQQAIINAMKEAKRK